MTLPSILAALAVLSLLLLLWQWVVAIRFPLHESLSDGTFQPALSVLKPLKGCDEFTEHCLRSWFEQNYRGGLQVLFGVASADDPVCQIVRALIEKRPEIDAQLVISGPPTGANAKVSTLIQLEKLAKHDIILISDADVWVPPDFLINVVAPLSRDRVGLVNCFYRLANPSTPAMRCEAVAINADFWSQVLQARSLKPLDFALGAVMATRRKQLAEIGGFTSLTDCLADDYQLGHRIARNGHSLELCPVVAECCSAPMDWTAVWKHQLRWARTIRVCQPVPYFFSILSNTGLWPCLWFVSHPTARVASFVASIFVVRIVSALHLQRRLAQNQVPRNPWWMPPLKDLLQVAVWAAAFLGNHIEWRGQRMRLRRDGTLVASKAR